MAAAAGKNESVSLSFLLEVNDLEVEKELSTVATLAWGRRNLDGIVVKRAERNLEETDL